MTNGINVLKGTVRGRTIELDREPGLPDGLLVAVTLLPALPPGQGLRKSFGSWAGDAAELDQFLDQVREDRRHER